MTPARVNNWKEVTLAIAFLTLFGGIVGVWVDTQRDIAELQVEVRRNKEQILYKADAVEVITIKSDIKEVKSDIKELLQRTAR